MTNVGKAKYVINYHDGKSKHNDGSDFFGINIFKNKIKFQKEINRLKTDGYVDTICFDGGNDDKI